MERILKVLVEVVRCGDRATFFLVLWWTLETAYDVVR
jgi:hypothetical protein